MSEITLKGTPERLRRYGGPCLFSHPKNLSAPPKIFSCDLGHASCICTYTDVYRSPGASALASAKDPRRASRSIRAPARSAPSFTPTKGPVPCTAHHSPPLAPSLAPVATPLPATLYSRPQPHTPLGTSTLGPKVAENLRPRPRCETPLPQPLTATPFDQVNRNTLKGRFASMQQCSIRPNPGCASQSRP